MFLGISTYYFKDIHAQTSSISSIQGYAWSSNIGWIEFDPDNIQVNTDGSIVGYAWSSNVGWLQFGGLSGAPTSADDAKIQNDRITGWAKFLSADGTVSGWDGWVLFGGQTHWVNLDSNTNQFSGYAWGDDVVGWIDFSGVSGVSVNDPICPNGATNWPDCSSCPGGGTPINNSCPPVDMCLNIDGNQATVPSGTIQVSGSQCICTNDAIDPSTCTTCSAGQVLNQLNQCVTTTCPAGQILNQLNQCVNPPPPPEPQTFATGTFYFKPKIVSNAQDCPLYLDISETLGCTVTNRQGQETDIPNTASKVIRSSGLETYNIGTYILSCTGTNNQVVEMGSLSCYSNPGVKEL